MAQNGMAEHENQMFFDYLDNIGLASGFEERMEEMQEDKLQREEEWKQDLMVHERAGIEDERRKDIPKLDASNNLSYQYLREHGNNYQYDPIEMNPKWKNRLYKRFDTMNKNTDTILHLSDVLYWPKRMQVLCKANAEEVEKVRKSLEQYFYARGVTDIGLNRENWIEANRVFMEAEKERKKQGARSLVAQVLSSYLDVVDEDGDNVVSIQELKRMLNVYRMPEESSYTFFYHADSLKKGKVQREEIYKLFNDFWFGAYDQSLDGVFAYKY